MLTFNVEEDAVGTRLDNYLSFKMPDSSRSFLQKLIASEKVHVNGSPAKTNYRLKSNDYVTVNLESLKVKFSNIDIPIIFEDNDCIVLDKPRGVLTHSKGAFNPETTVATFIKNKTSDMDGERAGIVHRLDRATSGVIIAAKSTEALKWLQKQFQQRKTKKIYYAVVEGDINPKKAIIDMPIERNPKKPQTFRVGAGGKPSQTTYEVVGSGNNYSLVRLEPATGRTHQLRVHLKQINHPIVGDSLYGGKEADRLYLHAFSLEITVPSKERKIFKSQLPKEFRKMIRVNNG